MSERRGFEEGVADFIRKPLSEDTHIQRIRNIINTHKKFLKVEEAASMDLLTGTMNKISINRELEHVCKESAGSLLMIDIDSFKPVNDLYGHDAGDRLLIRFAEILKRSAADNALCGRVGGDEFVLFWPDSKREGDIKKFTETINRSLMDAAFDVLGRDMHIPLGVSVGVALVPEMGTDYKELFRLADKALYNVKQSGKHNYSIYSEFMAGNFPQKTDLSLGGEDGSRRSHVYKQRAV